MPEQWLTYRQLGELWNTTPEAARARSRRGKYERRTNEQGMSEVLVDVDSVVDGSQSPSQSWMADLGPSEQDQGSPDQSNRQALQLMEEQVAALRWECRKAEQQAELLRRYLETEREQSAHLMKLLQQRHSGRKVGGRILARLLFWRTAGKATIDPAGHAVFPTPDTMRTGPVIGSDPRPDTPDALRSTPVTPPDMSDSLASNPDIGPDTAPDNPHPVPNSPDRSREASPDNGATPLS